MSNVYGVSSSDNCMSENVLKHLRYWNRLNEADWEEREVSAQVFTGVYQEHFNDHYPAEKPVIRTEKLLAVLDVVLFNREELISELNLKYVEISDENLLLQYIIEKGMAALHKVNGDFAGAIYDYERNTWTLFRDHMGIRPLFYYMYQDTFIFSTDIRGIASVSGLQSGINEELWFRHAMAYSDLTLCETDFKNIFCVVPASWMEVKCFQREFQAETHQYWELGRKKIRYKTDQEYQKQMYDLVSDAVKRRLDAVSGLIGGELSGGFDSTVVASLIGKYQREATFFSWSFSPEELPLREGEDERKVILNVCDRWGFHCTFHNRDTYQKCMEYQYSMKHRWPPSVNTIDLLEGSLYLKSQGAKVVFTGHGGDEGVSHRSNPYELWRKHEYLKFLKYFYQMKKGMKLWPLRVLHAIYFQFSVINPEKKAPYIMVKNVDVFLNDDFYNHMNHLIEALPLSFSYDAKKYIMEGGSRSRLDNIAFQGAAAGVRYMVPFLDYRVIDYAVSIPASQYLDGYRNRKIFRDTFKDFIPETLEQKAYKDTPSQRRLEEPSQEEIIQKKEGRKAKIKSVAKMLNRELWDSYLNMDKILNIDFSDEFTEQEDAVARHLNGLMGYCLLIQDILLFDQKERL